MAERWIPNPGAPVGPQEPIGRRLFDEPDLVGAKDQKPKKEYLDLRHFEERRSPIEVSFDRLGERSIDKKVLNFLAPLCRRQGDAFAKRKKFGGWTWIQSTQLANPPRGTRFPVVPSPILLNQPADPEHNPYHAHTTGQETHSVALHLQYLFSKYGKMRECPGSRPA
ncbi:MAG: hypothetical protein ABSG12_15470 [Steroidobacteraceae bacterium]